MRATVLMTIFALAGCGALEERGINNPFDGDDKVEITTERGPEGPQGPKGEKGDKGDTQTGATGEQGPEGPQGPRGEDGQNGQNGNDGQTGPQGPRGEDGEDGQDGQTGPRGPQGEPGNDGQNGQDGQNGSDGQDGEPCTVADHGTYVEILCPNSQPVRIDRPQNSDPTFTICVWIDWCTVQTIRDVPLSDINGGVYDIAHLGACRHGGQQQ